jgi:glycosyltransferase involved in cell wall biosynthesis
MKILFLTENFPPETNASASRVFERACYWVKWGHEVTVVTCAPNFPSGKVFPGYSNRWYQTEIMDGIRVVRVKTFIARNRGVVRRTLDFLSFMLSGIAGGLVQTRPDVVVATSPQFFAAVGGWVLACLKRRPFVFELGDLWPASITAVGAMRKNIGLKLMESLELFLYRRSAAIVALTRAFKENLVSRGISPGKIAVVRNGVDMTRYAPRSRDRHLAEALNLNDMFVIGYIGTHGMAHDLGNVLNAAEILVSEKNIRFLFVGAGAARERLVAEAGRRNLDNIVFVPPQPKAEVQRYWSLCDLALAHLKDNSVFAGVIPSKIFEAMGMGLPVLLVAPAGEASEIVIGEHAGYWVPAARPDVLAETICRIVTQPEELQRTARNSLSAAPRYSRERQARDMIEVLEYVARGHGERAADAVSA